MGPDADRRAKLLIYQVMEGSILDAYLQPSSTSWASATVSVFLAASSAIL
jgi:hypothetical protein